jgi:tetratricopeptide (TPR) repeat protein
MKLEQTNGAAPDDAGSVFRNDISAARFKKALVFLFLLGLIVRLGFIVEHAQTPSFGVLTLDQKYYDTVAKMLLSGEDLHVLHGFRPLLYPMFLAALYKPGGSAGITLVLFAQHLFGVATGVIVALLGARLFQHRISGLAGGALYLLAPVPLYFEGELLTESGYTFLICAALLLHLHAAGTGGWKGAVLWVLGGGLIALASQARTNILVFLAVYPLFAAWRWQHLRGWVGLLPLLGLLGAFGMMVPWGIVNLRQSDHFHLIPNAGGVNLFLGNKRTADGMMPRQGRRVNYSSEHYEDSVEVWAREEYAAAEVAQGREPGTDPMAISRYWTHRTLDEIKADPAGWLRLMATKSWLMFWNAEVPNNKSFAFLQAEFTWLRLLPVRWVVLLMLAPAGIWAAAKWGNRDALFILLVYAGLYSLGNIAFFICDRYRYPIWPAMAAIGGGGLIAWLNTIRLRRFRNALWILGGAALMAALSLHNWAGAVLPDYASDYRYRSVAWFETGHFPQALKDIDRSIELDPTEPASLHQRGNVLLALNRLDEARDAFEKTLKISPEESGAWNNLGFTLVGQGRLEEALQAFRSGMECRPPSKNAFLGMAFVQIRLGRLDDATATLDQLDKLNGAPESATLAARSVIARRRGNSQQADALEHEANALDANAVRWAIEQATGTIPNQ